MIRKNRDPLLFDQANTDAPSSHRNEVSLIRDDRLTGTKCYNEQGGSRWWDAITCHSVSIARLTNVAHKSQYQDISPIVW
jgi:hypothetical protein